MGLASYSSDFASTNIPMLQPDRWGTQIFMGINLSQSEDGGTQMATVFSKVTPASRGACRMGFVCMVSFQAVGLWTTCVKPPWALEGQLWTLTLSCLQKTVEDNESFLPNHPLLRWTSLFPWGALVILMWKKVQTPCSCCPEQRGLSSVHFFFKRKKN